MDKSFLRERIMYLVAGLERTQSPTVHVRGDYVRAALGDKTDKYIIQQMPGLAAQRKRRGKRNAEEVKRLQTSAPDWTMNLVQADRRTLCAALTEWLLRNPPE